MPVEIQLNLKYVECHKSNEEDDEVYCLVTTRYAESDHKLEVRLPKGETWKLKSGQSLGPNLPLFDGPVDAGLSLEVLFMEDDGAGLTRVVDDKLGGFILEVRPDLGFKWTPLDKSAMLPTLSDGVQPFQLNDGKAEYRVAVVLYEKRVVC